MEFLRQWWHVCQLPSSHWNAKQLNTFRNMRRSFVSPAGNVYGFLFQENCAKYQQLERAWNKESNLKKTKAGFWRVTFLFCFWETHHVRAISQKKSLAELDLRIETQQRQRSSRKQATQKRGYSAENLNFVMVFELKLQRRFFISNVISLF